MSRSILFIVTIFIIILAGCTAQPPSVTTPTTELILSQEPGTPTLIDTATVEASESPTIQSTEATLDLTATLADSAPTVTLTAIPLPTEIPTDIPQSKPPMGYWKNRPVIPEVSNTVVEIYERGLELGNNPHAYSKIGDCGSTPAWFLGDFDRGSEFYDLGEYQDLNTVIQIFQGSHGRTSLAADAGFNASSLFVNLWADRSYCDTDETPLSCEYRVHRPSFAFIMLGSNDIYHPDNFEPQMRKILEYLMENGVIPILSTKADNEEGDHSINSTIARLAYEYDLPLWNYWLAVQSLPSEGLQEDQVHLTWGRNFFNDPDAMQKAWPVRNLTALQVLDAVWRHAEGLSIQQ
jgi:hypothetical protein